MIANLVVRWEHHQKCTIYINHMLTSYIYSKDNCNFELNFLFTCGGMEGLQWIWVNCFLSLLLLIHLVVKRLVCLCLTLD